MSVQKMRAQLLNDYADGIFKEVSVDRPVAGKGQVLVRIVVSGVNPIDTKIRAGVAPYAMPELPAILGTDLAGVVEEVGRCYNFQSRRRSLWSGRWRTGPSRLAG